MPRASLADGNADGAVNSQGRALEALRRGAQSLAQQMQQQGMMGMGPGQPGRLGRPRRLGPPRAHSRRPTPRATAAWPRLRRRRNRQGSRRDRRAARPPHPGRAAPPLQQTSTPAARTRVHRAVAYAISELRGIIRTAEFFTGRFNAGVGGRPARHSRRRETRRARKALRSRRGSARQAPSARSRWSA